MSDQQFWDSRYTGQQYVYGIVPNDFLTKQIGRIEGPVLSLAEGEGRNAVFLAQAGLDVLGVDVSAVGLEKAERLASAQGVRIQTERADLAHFVPRPQHYGTVISIFAHLPSHVRQRLYPRVANALRRGGLLVLEAYTEAQLQRSTGGPKNADLLMSADKIRAEFPELEVLLLRETERDVREGEGHNGLASVVQFIGRKT